MGCQTHQDRTSKCPMTLMLSSQSRPCRSGGRKSATLLRAVWAALSHFKIGKTTNSATCIRRGSFVTAQRGFDAASWRMATPSVALPPIRQLARPKQPRKPSGFLRVVWAVWVAGVEAGTFTRGGISAAFALLIMWADSAVHTISSTVATILAILWNATLPSPIAAGGARPSRRSVLQR